MRVAICGSRDWADLDKVRALVRSLPRNTVVVTDTADGVGATVLEEAKSCGLTVSVHWPIDGQGAALGRDKRLIADCDRAFFFWTGKTNGKGGTHNKIRLAREMGKDARIYTPADVQEDLVPLVMELIK